MSGNFVQLRRGVRQHVLDGRISLLQFGAYCLILIGTDAKDGTWMGSAPRLAGETGITKDSADGILGRLCEAGYIASLRVRGQRGNRPYAIDKYLVTVGPMTGRYVNAAESAKQGQLCFYETDDKACDETSDKTCDETCDTTFYSRHQDNKNLRTQEKPIHSFTTTASPSSAESETGKPETLDRPPVDGKTYEKLEDVPRSDQARILTSRLFIDLGEPKDKRKQLSDWKRELEPLCDQFEFPLLCQAIRWAVTESPHWPKFIRRAGNLVSKNNAENIVDDYRAHLRGKATYERAQKQAVTEVDKKKQAPSNYGSGGKIKLEGTYEL